MVARNKPVARIRKVLARVATSATTPSSFFIAEHTPVVARQSGIGVVLSRSFVVGSIMLWLAYFMGLVIFYASINWMPILLKEAGLTPQRATLVSALFNG